MMLLYETETLSTTIQQSCAVCNLSFEERSHNVCDLISRLFAKARKIRNYEAHTGIDSFYSSIKTLSSQALFPHNAVRLFGFYFKICMRRHHKEKAWRRMERKVESRVCGGVAIATVLFCFRNLFTRHFMRFQIHRPQMLLVSFFVPSWTLSSKWKLHFNEE